MSNHVFVAPRNKRSWSGIAPGAEAVAGAQFLVAMVLWWVSPGESDAYGVGYGTFAIGLFLEVAVACAFLPPLSFVAGWVHGTLFTIPVMELSHAAGVRTRIPASRWALPVLALLAGLYAAPVALLARTSYVATWGWTAAAGVLPVGVAVYARMRRRTKLRVRLWTLAATLIAVPTALLAGFVMPPYEPPALERSDYVGVWTGSGVSLELDAQGGAMAQTLPVEDGLHEVDTCSGRGTWERAAGSSGGDGPGVVLSVAECEEARLYWQVAGTADEPQLFVLIGDPDGGDVRVLRKRAR
ncbi:hypothetical protein OHA37_21575 [Streptomyces sp. NBC_00335]|uniref:hypothetical protein n=1 Tax=unclassified Streptomyces TaxID=2593676 RepID=UPI00225A4AC9|nr:MULTISPECIES: hypothetical protein [unclassified Streptomyces]MCX5406453.1 hypothetical protein [Streptomyces sp. NBC_00086]